MGEKCNTALELYEEIDRKMPDYYQVSLSSWKNKALKEFMLLPQPNIWHCHRYYLLLWFANLWPKIEFKMLEWNKKNDQTYMLTVI